MSNDVRGGAFAFHTLTAADVRARACGSTSDYAYKLVFVSISSLHNDTSNACLGPCMLGAMGGQHEPKGRSYHDRTP